MVTIRMIDRGQIHSLNPSSMPPGINAIDERDPKNVLCVVAEDVGEVVGLVICALEHGRGGSEGVIRYVWLHEDRYGMGIVAEMLRTLTNVLKSRKIRRVRFDYRCVA